MKDLKDIAFTLRIEGWRLQNWRLAAAILRRGEDREHKRKRPGNPQMRLSRWVRDACDREAERIISLYRQGEPTRGDWREAGGKGSKLSSPFGPKQTE